VTNTRILLWVVLAGFVGLTSFVVAEVGYLGFFEGAMSGWVSRLLFVDLTITLTLVLVWMYLDSQESGQAFAPYALVTLLFGAAGPLLYLVRRKQAVRTST
jgi:hypothetical protein